MGILLNLSSIARLDDSLPGYLGHNFRRIQDALRTIDWSDVGAAASSHTHTITIENWIAPSFLNGWINYGAGYGEAKYYKDPHGRVYLMGLIKSGTLFTSAFQLPVGYRPLADKLYVVMTNDTWGQIRINSNGNVFMQNVSNIYVSLDQLHFRSEQ